eukprot:7492714-Pyramimonas_sp.AAC.1
MISGVREVVRKLSSPEETYTQCLVAGSLLVFDTALCIMIFLKIPCEFCPIYPSIDGIVHHEAWTA